MKELKPQYFLFSHGSYNNKNIKLRKGEVVIMQHSNNYVYWNDFTLTLYDLARKKNMVMNIYHNYIRTKEYDIVGKFNIFQNKCPDINLWNDVSFTDHNKLFLLHSWINKNLNKYNINMVPDESKQYINVTIKKNENDTSEFSLRLKKLFNNSSQLNLRNGVFECPITFNYNNKLKKKKIKYFISKSNNIDNNNYKYLVKLLKNIRYNFTDLNIYSPWINITSYNIKINSFNNTLGEMIKIIRNKTNNKPFVLLCIACRKHEDGEYKYSIMKNLDTVTKKNSFRFKDIEDHKYILYK